ncbi:DNA-binding response OmpR family regulator [Inquilinus ginsengisoli]|uniref:response regulator n=1 Tax=Inquilinus ginsengisoli TaxID=363840 RepID=UPI003D1AB532
MTPAQPHVIVVDDEAGLRALLADYLSLNGVSVRTADGGAALDACLAEAPADIVVLDLNMPEEGGLAIARRLRGAGSDIAIIILTAAAERGARLEAFGLGIDDYVAKPFEPRELLARIRSVMRRLSSRPGKPAARRVPVGTHLYDFDAKSLVDSAGKQVGLTTRECEMLEAFLRHPRQPLSRERLSWLAHGEALEAGTRSIDLRVMRLRRKIEAHPDAPRLVRTVPGEGYLFDPSGGLGAENVFLLRSEGRRN